MPEETVAQLEQEVATLEAEEKAQAQPGAETPPPTGTAAEATQPPPVGADAIRAQLRQELEAENKKTLDAELHKLRSDEGRRIGNMVRDAVRQELAKIQRRTEHGLSEEEKAELTRGEQAQEQQEQQTAALQRLWKPIQAIATELGLDPMEAPEFTETIDLWRIGDFRGARAAAREIKDARQQAKPPATASAPAATVPAQNGAQAASSPARTPMQTTAARQPAGSTGPIATADNIDELYMQWEREHPDRPNPYEDKYRIVLNRGRI